MSDLDYHRAATFIAAIPRGRWASFKDVATIAGNPAAAMPIGNWLREEGYQVRNYWRVISADGRVRRDSSAERSAVRAIRSLPAGCSGRRACPSTGSAAQARSSASAPATGTPTVVHTRNAIALLPLRRRRGSSLA